jgi:hypothetical protein
MMKLLSVAGLAIAALCVLAVPASAASINVSPSTSTPGGTVTVSGDVLVNGQPGCQVPGTVTLISNAFAGLGEFAGEGAVFATADATGHYSKTVTLSSSVAPGTYTITGRCGGGNLGVQATLTVSGGLARTGGGVGPVSSTELLLGASTLLLVGGAGTAYARRRPARGTASL